MHSDTSGRPDLALLRVLAGLMRMRSDRIHGSMTIGEMTRLCSDARIGTEEEISQAIRWGASNGWFVLKGDPSDEKVAVSASDHESDVSVRERLKLVVSIPKFTELGLDRMRREFDMMETRAAFRKVFLEAKNVLRISSPFIEKSVLDDDGLPDIEELTRFALERGCRILLLTREAADKRRNQIEWLVNLAVREGYRDQLQIFDYHLQDEKSRIISSTHSKLVIADKSLAYVGSAEIRKNSLTHNFEVGCLIEGPEVDGLCHVFDLMTRYAERVL